MVKLRLKRMGSKYNAFYRIVAADERDPRDGKFIEEIGYYNPHSKEIRVNKDLKDKWLAQGAAPSTTVKNLLTKVDKLGLKSNEVGFLPKNENKAKKVIPHANVIVDVVEKQVSKENKTNEIKEEVVENNTNSQNIESVPT